jgi:uncharacterized membrane protein
MKKKDSPSNYTFGDFIKSHRPGTEDISVIPAEELNTLRKDYIEQLLEEEVGELTEVEKVVAKSISQRNIISARHLAKEDKNLSFGERLADTVAAFGGSWKFIIIFFLILLGWILLNIWWLSNKAFDPYPFILLNLILSCLAAIQAPIIMMSQNRQETKDRLRAEHDYKINLKAEVEIRMLHEKLDHILLHQNKRLLEIQKVQMEMMDSIGRMIREQKG